MNLKQQMDYPNPSPAEQAVVRVSDLMKQVELMAGIRERIGTGYYDRPDVLADVAARLHQRLNP